MKRINYQRIIPNFVGPRLAYHGFKFDEVQSIPLQGYYTFTRNYWCAIQRVTICPVEYDRAGMEAAVAQNRDCPTEAPRMFLGTDDPGAQKWLSSKYVLSVLQNDHHSLTLWPDRPISWKPGPPLAREDLLKKLTTGRIPEPGERHPDWWEFHGEDDLKRVLSEIVQITINDGLDWFEYMTADVRRYHEKLDRRRLALKSKLVKESGDQC